MSDSRNKFIKKYQNEIAVQAASLSILPFWYPLFSMSLHQRAKILESKFPDDLSHSTLFSKKRGFYRGITANLFMQPLFPYSEWLLTKILTNIQHIQQRDPSLKEKLFAGFITGASTSLAANPYEVTVISAQNHNEQPSKSFARVWKTAGVSGFLTGIGPMSIRNGTFLTGLFVTTPELKKCIDKRISKSTWYHDFFATVLGSAIPAGVFTATVVLLDLGAIMRQSDPKQEKFKTTLNALNEAYKKHGISAFKTGVKLRFFACVVEMAGFNLFHKKYDEMLSDPPSNNL